MTRAKTRSNIVCTNTGKLDVFHSLPKCKWHYHEKGIYGKLNFKASDSETADKKLSTLLKDAKKMGVDFEMSSRVNAYGIQMMYHGKKETFPTCQLDDNQRAEQVPRYFSKVSPSSFSQYR